MHGAIIGESQRLYFHALEAHNTHISLLHEVVDDLRA